MPLDVITYTQNADQSFSRTVVSVVVNLAEEIAALQMQLANFQQGQQTPDIQAAIQNYTQQLPMLLQASPQTSPPTQEKE